jgi:hypothetical protein
MNITKGGWEATKAFNKNWFVGNGDISIAHDIKSPDDAHLISAAPDMYEALKQAADWFMEMRAYIPLHSKTLSDIQQALSKAEGK